MFEDVEVRGQLLHYITRLPIAGINVTLRTDDAHSNGLDPAGIMLGFATTALDGSFAIKSKAAKGRNYYLEFDPKSNPGPNGTDTSFSNTRDRIIDTGPLFTGEYIIRYVLELSSTSSECIWFFQKNSPLKIRAGVDTTVYFETIYRKEQYQKNEGRLKVNFHRGPCDSVPTAPGATLFLPVSIADTLRFQIGY